MQKNGGHFDMLQFIVLMGAVVQVEERGLRSERSRV